MDMPPTVPRVLLSEVASSSGLFRLLGSVYLAVAYQGSYASQYVIKSSTKLMPAFKTYFEEEYEFSQLEI
jgi:hypothetical protein